MASQWRSRRSVRTCAGACDVLRDGASLLFLLRVIGRCFRGFWVPRKCNGVRLTGWFDGLCFRDIASRKYRVARTRKDSLKCISVGRASEIQLVVQRYALLG